MKDTTCSKCKGVNIFDSFSRRRQGDKKTNSGKAPACSWKTGPER